MEPDDSTYQVTGALLTDERVGPLYASCAEAQTLARAAIATVGGTARILRQSDDGWVEVARYTDTGVFSRGAGGLVTWAVVAADEDEPDWAAPPRRLFAGLLRRR